MENSLLNDMPGIMFHYPYLCIQEGYHIYLLKFYIFFANTAIFCEHCMKLCIQNSGTSFKIVIFYLLVRKLCVYAE